MNIEKFFTVFRTDKRLGASRLTQAQVDVAQAIIKKASGMRRAALAYVLATAWHEAKMTPVRENMMYSAKRIRQVWPTRPEAVQFAGQPISLANAVYNGRLGNRPGTNDGWNYRGGGLDQLTGRENFQKVGIAENPDSILQPDVAVSSLVSGMTLGRYRGHKLSDYFTATASNFEAARDIINADRNRKEGNTTVGRIVAGYAEAFDAALRQAGYDATEDWQRPALAITTPVGQPSPVVPVVGKGAQSWTIGGAVVAVVSALYFWLKG